MIRTRQELIDARKKYAAVLDAEKKKNIGMCRYRDAFQAAHWRYLIG